MPLEQWGYARPLLNGQDRNYSDPQGRPVLISGLVSTVRSGSDIFPFVNAGTLSPNCITLSGYMPPTYVSYIVQYGSPETKTLEHDARFLDANGVILNPWSSVGSQVYYGSFFAIQYSKVQAINSIRITFTVNTQRTCLATVENYEGGGDGVVTAAFSGGATLATSALRLSDNSYQVLANGGISIAPGRSVFYFAITWSTGSIFPSDILTKVRFLPEVPYGL